MPPSNALYAAMRVWLGYPKSVAAAMISANSGSHDARGAERRRSRENSFWQECPDPERGVRSMRSRRPEEAAGTRESWDDAVPDLVP